MVGNVYSYKINFVSAYELYTNDGSTDTKTNLFLFLFMYLLNDGKDVDFVDGKTDT